MLFPYTLVSVTPDCLPRVILPTGPTALALFGLYGAVRPGYCSLGLAAIGYAARWEGRFVAGVVRPASNKAGIPSLARLLGLIFRSEDYSPDALPPAGLPVYAHFQSPSLVVAHHAFSPQVPLSDGRLRLRMRVPWGPSQVFAASILFQDVGAMGDMASLAWLVYPKCPDVLRPAYPAVAWKRPWNERIADDIISRQAEMVLLQRLLQNAARTAP